MIDIKLILEGSEEETFFQILEEGGFVRSDRYRLSYWNAHGAGNVPTLFNQAFQNSDPEDIVLAVYDVDLLRTDEFHTVQRKMRTILGSQNEVDRMSIWCNPTSLLLLLAPCSDTKIPLNGKSKKGSSKLVHRFFPQIATESKPYDAQAFQLKAIKDAFQYDSYHLDSLLDRIALYSDDINDPPSTNILPLLKAFIRNQLNGLSGSE